MTSPEVKDRWLRIELFILRAYLLFQMGYKLGEQVVKQLDGVAQKLGLW